MYFMADICRICLREDKQLEDVAKETTKHKDVIKKLELCVPEVDWRDIEELLLCPKCLENANALHEFKLQCCRSRDTFRLYTKTLREENEPPGKKTNLTVPVTKSEVSKEALDRFLKYEAATKPPPPLAVPPLILNPQVLNQVQTKTVPGNLKPAPFVSVLPEQNKLLANGPRLIIPNAANSSFQNVFLNLVPMNIARPTRPTAPATPSDPKTNVIIPNNNTFYMIYQNQQVGPAVGVPKLQQLNTTTPKPQVTSIPRLHVPNILRKADIKLQQPQQLIDVNVNKILKENQTEELSVEINPLDFDLSESEDSKEDKQSEDDWDDIITPNKIVPALPKMMQVEKRVADPVILPKPAPEEGVDFFNSGHFLFPEESPYTNYVKCEQCSQHFETIKALRMHIKMRHNSKYPFKCQTCSSEYAVREHFLAHVKKHNKNKVDFDRPITLADLERDKNLLEAIPPGNESDELSDSSVPNLLKHYKCNLCYAKFSTIEGVKRHKIRRHGDNPPKKYFVKGMKNAFCTVCKRKFSTQSYLQIHMNQHIKRGECSPDVLNETKKEINGGKRKSSLKLDATLDESSDSTKVNNAEEDDDLPIDPSSLLETRMELEEQENNSEPAVTEKHEQQQGTLRIRTDLIEDKNDKTNLESESSTTTENTSISGRAKVGKKARKAQRKSDPSDESITETSPGSLKIKINLRDIKENEKQKEASEEQNSINEAMEVSSCVDEEVTESESLDKAPNNQEDTEMCESDTGFIGISLEGDTTQRSTPTIGN